MQLSHSTRLSEFIVLLVIGRKKKGEKISSENLASLY